MSDGMSQGSDARAEAEDKAYEKWGWASRQVLMESGNKIQTVLKTLRAKKKDIEEEINRLELEEHYLRIVLFDEANGQRRKT